jgi:hypothetical protein
MAIMKRKYFLALSYLLIFSGCGNYLKDEEGLTFQKMEYFGKELKLDGYFCNKLNLEWGIDLILYRNGIAIKTLFDNKTLTQYEDDFRSGKFAEKYKNRKFAWGLFQVINDTIKVEFLSAIGESSAYPSIDIGLILNDSTIHFVKRMRSNGKYVENKNTMYHFKQFHPKPDSINSWVR